MNGCLRMKTYIHLIVIPSEARNLSSIDASLAGKY